MSADEARWGVVKGCGCGQPAFIGLDNPEPNEDLADGRQEAERLWGHPLQYALIGKITIVHSEHMDDAQVRAAAGSAGACGLPIERFNRCPTCEEWSPCQRRKLDTDCGHRVGPVAGCNGWRCQT